MGQINSQIVSLLHLSKNEDGDHNKANNNDRESPLYHNMEQDVQEPVMGNGYCPIYDAALVGDWKRLVELCDGTLDFYEMQKLGSSGGKGAESEGSGSDRVQNLDLEGAPSHDTAETEDSHTDQGNQQQQQEQPQLADMNDDSEHKATDPEREEETPGSREEWLASLNIVGEMDDSQKSAEKATQNSQQSQQHELQQESRQEQQPETIIDEDEHDEGPDHISEEDLQFKIPRYPQNDSSDQCTTNGDNKNNDKRNSNNTQHQRQHHRISPPLFIDPKGNTPLHIAARRNPPRAAIQALLSLHPHAAFITTHDGWLPLHLLCYCGCDVEVASQLLDAMEIEIHLRDKFGEDWRTRIMTMEDIGDSMQQQQQQQHQQNQTQQNQQNKSNNKHPPNEKDAIRKEYDDPLLPRDTKGRTPIHHACASSRDPLRRPDLIRLLLLRSKNPRKAAMARDWFVVDAERSSNNDDASFGGGTNGNSNHGADDIIMDAACAASVNGIDNNNHNKESSSDKNNSTANTATNSTTPKQVSNENNNRTKGRTPLDLILDDYREEIEEALSPGFSIPDAIAACRGEILNDVIDEISDPTSCLVDDHGNINTNSNSNSDSQHKSSNSNNSNLGTLYECWAIMSILLLAAGTPGSTERIVGALGGKCQEQQLQQSSNSHSTNNSSNNFRPTEKHGAKGRGFLAYGGVKRRDSESELSLDSSMTMMESRSMSSGGGINERFNIIHDVIATLPHAFTKECHEVVRDFQAIHVACNSIGEDECPRQFTALAKKLVQGEIDKRRIGSVSELRGRWESKLGGGSAKSLVR